MAPGLLEFPLELLHRIYSQCSPADIRSLRCVNWHSNTVANEYWLEEIPLMFSKHDYKTMKDLVQNNPLSAKGVRRIRLEVDVYEANRFQVDGALYDTVEEHGFGEISCEYPNYSEGLADVEPTFYLTDGAGFRPSFGPHVPRSLLWTANSGARDVGNPTKERVQQAWSYCLALCREQRDLMTMTNRVIPETFLAIFRACTRLETIDIVPPMVRSWTAGKQFRKAMIAPWNSWNSSEHRPRRANEAVSTRLFAAMIWATKISKETNSFRGSLRNLSAVSLPKRLFEKFKEPGAEKIFSSMNSLRSLTLRASPYSHMDQGHISQDTDKFDNRIVPGLQRDLIALAPNLQQLTLAGYGLLWHFIPSATWPNLRMVDLHWFACQADVLIDFLQRHADTLVELRLSSLSVKSSWRTTFQAIAGTLPMLQSVRLREGFHAPRTDEIELWFGDDEDEYTKKFEKWIIKGGEDMPEP